jgi:tetratricopeptide (TPR) repeat protein
MRNQHQAMTKVLRLILPALSFAMALAIAPARAQTAPPARCTGEADIPWSEQITECSKTIDSGKYAGKDLAKLLIFRGKAHAFIRDFDGSLTDIEQAIQLDPNDAFAAGARGDVYLLKKDYDHALAAYTKATELDPNSPFAFIGLGMAHIAKGEPDGALAAFEQAVQVQPTNAAALYWRGIAKRQNGDLEAAEADIAAARKIDPSVQ